MCLRFDREADKSYEGKCMKTLSVSNCTYCNMTSVTFGADMDKICEQLQGGIVVKCGMSIEQHASNIYTRAMFEQFRNLIYHAQASHIHKPAHPDILPSYRNMLSKDEEVDKFLALVTIQIRLAFKSWPTFREDVLICKRFKVNYLPVL